MDEQELQASINSDITSRIPAHAWGCTVGIVIAIGDTVHQFGTGTLFAVADHHFVVTAGHVIRQAQESDKTLAVTASGSQLVPVADDEWKVTSARQYGSLGDPLDIAVYRLPPDVVASFDGRLFLRFEDISFETPLPTAVYSVFGFPAILAQPSSDATERVQLQPFQFTTYRFDRSTDHLDGFQDGLHILLDAQRQQATDTDGAPAVFVDNSGNEARFPGDLGGISGCSVWHIGDRMTPIPEWNVESARIVAVQTSVYHSSQAIKATRWVAVSTLIHEAFPELRPAFGMWRPA